MGMFDCLTDFFSDDDCTSMCNSGIGSDPFFDNGCMGDLINPATGLPMVGCVDIEGNPYGVGSSPTLDSGIDDFTSS